VEPAVRTESVHKIYQSGDQRVAAVDGISLEIAQGEFAAIAGPSGSGKTTLLNLIGALDVPDDGRIWVDGSEITRLDRSERAELRKHKVGFIFQSYNLIEVLSALENAEFVLLLQGVPLDERERRVRAVFEKIGLAGLENRRPHQLSGGQQQRVAIARAIVAEPALILADEPTANLDSVTGAALLDVMGELNQTIGTTFLFSTHDPRVMERASRLIRLVDGRIDGNS
jgi:putative ABC transport system ATP-binding protein